MKVDNETAALQTIKFPAIYILYVYIYTIYIYDHICIYIYMDNKYVYIHMHLYMAYMVCCNVLCLLFGVVELRWGGACYICK